MVLQAQGDLEKAEEAYGKALDLDANNSAAAFRLAFLYDLEGDEDQAIELYQQCLKTPPVNTNALINLAVLFEDDGRWNNAESCLKTVLAVQPNRAGRGCSSRISSPPRLCSTMRILSAAPCSATP